MAVASTVVIVPPGPAVSIFTATGVGEVIIQRTGARAYLGGAGVTVANGFPLEDILQMTVRAGETIFALAVSPTGASATFHILAGH